MDFELDVVLRFAAATVVGAAIGLDREVRRKPAGLKTHALVALGSAVATYAAAAVSRGDDGSAEAISRAIQGVIAGVGLLGGGAILKSDRETISGLTTAASIWVVAALGVACGAGLWLPAIVAVILALAVLLFGDPIEQRLHRRSAKRNDVEDT